MAMVGQNVYEVLNWKGREIITLKRRWKDLDCKINYYSYICVIETKYLKQFHVIDIPYLLW